MPESTTYQTAVDEKRRLENELEAFEKNAAEEKIRLQRELTKRRDIIRTFEHHGSALGEAAVIARSILEIKWSRDRAGNEVAKAINTAIEWFREPHIGGLPTGYFGVKEYDRGDSQYEGHMQYGYGPRHGSIWFSVGLLPEWRGDAALTLTEEQRLACIQWLTVLRDTGKELLGG